MNFILHRNSSSRKAWSIFKQRSWELEIQMNMPGHASFYDYQWNWCCLCRTHPQCCIAGSRPPFATPAIAFQLPVITAKSTQPSWKLKGSNKKANTEIPQNSLRIWQRKMNWGWNKHGAKRCKLLKCEEFFSDALRSSSFSFKAWCVRRNSVSEAIRSKWLPTNSLSSKFFQGSNGQGLWHHLTTIRLV